MTVYYSEIPLQCCSSTGRYIRHIVIMGYTRMSPYTEEVITLNNSYSPTYHIDNLQCVLCLMYVFTNNSNDRSEIWGM